MIIQRLNRMLYKKIVIKWMCVITLSGLLCYFLPMPSLTDLASAATVFALILTVISLRHSTESLKETKVQIDKSNIRSVASTFLSKLENIFDNISYRFDANQSETATGRAAVLEAFITMDGSRNHYLSVDLLGGYFTFYLNYLNYLVTNKLKLGGDFEVHMAAVEHDFILLKNEISSLVMNLKLLRNSNNQYNLINDTQKSYEALVEFHTVHVLKHG